MKSWRQGGVVMKNSVVILLIFVALVIGIAIGTSTTYCRGSQEETPHKQLEKNKIEFYRADAREYHVYYARINDTADNSIRINIEFYLPVKYMPQLNNEVVMQIGDILSFTNLDQEDKEYRQLIIVHSGFYPGGGAIIKEFKSVQDAKKYVNETIGKDPASVNVIKRKTGD